MRWRVVKKRLQRNWRNSSKVNERVLGSHLLASWEAGLEAVTSPTISEVSDALHARYPDVHEPAYALDRYWALVGPWMPR